MTTATGILIYGPQGCGKTLNTPAIARHFGVAEADVHTTNDPGEPGARDFYQVMAEINGKVGRP